MAILTEALVRLNAVADSKEAAIKMAGELLVQAGRVTPAYVEGMLARERTMSTYMGNGVAIPHGEFENRADIGFSTTGAVREAVEEALLLLDSGKARVAEPGTEGNWQVNQWLKKAVLLSFRLNDMALIAGGPDGARWWDKVPSKFAAWGEAEFRAAGFRARAPKSFILFSASSRRI